MGFLTDLGNTWSGSSGGGGSALSKEQLPYLQDLWKQAQGQAGNTSGQQYSQQFQQPVLNAFNTLAGGGNMIPGLQSGYQNFGAQSNQALDSAVNSGLDSMSQNFTRNIMPSINQGAALTGTTGGSRQAIAQSNAANDFNKEASNYTNQMYSNNWQNQMQNQYAGLQGLQGLQGQQNRSMLGSLTQAPSASNMGFGSQYGNLMNYKNIIGSPVTLGNETFNNAGIGGLFNDAAGGFTGYKAGAFG